MLVEKMLEGGGNKMNCVTLIGRVASDLKYNKRLNISKVKIEVTRNYPNIKEFYEVDCFDVKFYRELDESEMYYCDKGVLIAIRGRLLKQKNKITIIGEQINFLAEKEMMY